MRFVERRGNCVENAKENIFADEKTFIYFVRISYHFETKKWYQTNSDETINFSLEIPLKGPGVSCHRYLNELSPNFVPTVIDSILVDKANSDGKKNKNELCPTKRVAVASFYATVLSNDI